jgi:hypothetical protein
MAEFSSSQDLTPAKHGQFKLHVQHPDRSPHHGLVTKAGGYGAVNGATALAKSLADSLIPHRIMSLAMMGVLHVSLETSHSFTVDRFVYPPASL